MAAADSSVAITQGTGTPIRVITGVGASAAGQQVFTLADATGTLVPTDSDGTLQVSNDPTSLFLDDFSGTLTTNWTTGGTAPAVSGGVLTTSESTTASATSYLRTNLPFQIRAAAYLRVSHQVTIEAAATANNTRWWGYGTNATTPSATAPITNGAAFMLDSANAGALEAVTYSAGTKTVVATLTRPSDAAMHRYEIAYKQSVTYWLIDGVTVATKTFANLAVANGMYAIVGAANTATSPGAHTFNVSSVTVGDTGRNNQTISDGVIGSLMGTVKQGSVPAPAVTDNPLYVEALQVPSTYATATAATGVATTLTLTAPGAGLRHYITSITFEQYCTAATTGSATPIVSTASNTTLVSDFTTAMAVGTIVKDVRALNSPVMSTAQNTATSFTLPATTGIIWRITAGYYIAP